MTAILSITFPIFAVVALGWGCVRFGLFRPQDLRVLSSFVMNIAIPALLFSAVTTAGTGVFDPGYMSVYAAGSLATLGLAYLWFRLGRMARARAAVATLGTCLSNTGYVGYPILLLAWPAVAQQVFAMNVLIENFLVLPLCLALMALDTSGRGPVATVLVALWQTVKRPLMLAVLLGLALVLLGIGVPVAVARLASLLGSATAPLALFYIGGSLAGLALSGNRLAALQIVAGKLVLHPAMMLAAIALVPLAGLPGLSAELRAPLLVMAALPMFGIYPILAGEKGHQGMASIAMLVATVVSFFTVSGLLAVLH